MGEKSFDPLIAAIKMIAAISLIMAVVFTPISASHAQAPVDSKTPTTQGTRPATTPVGPTPTGSHESGNQVILTAPDLKSFPTISAYLNIRSADGHFVNLLQAGQVTVLEDNNPRPVENFQQLQPGVRVIVAVNAAPGMGVRNSQGQTRYDLVIKSLQNWASRPATANNQDDFNLLANQNTQTTALSNPLDWLAALNAYQPDFRKVQPSLDSLSAALMLANSAVPRTGMGQSILYITSPFEQDAQASITDLTDRAQRANVQVNIWIVGGTGDFETDGAKVLEKMAVQTGGSFQTFTGKEDLPDMEQTLKPLRGIYQFQYFSAVNTSGSHTLVVKITGLSSEVSSPAQFFNLTITPPNPMFLSPPVKITRKSPTGSPNPQDNLTPVEQSLQILVEFPDGHNRPLKYSRLYVDGKLVSENDAPPFDRFTWNLSAYTVKGEHNLRVEVQDMLGLSRTSIVTPVDIEISMPPAILSLSHLNLWIGLGAAVIAGVVLTLVLVSAWRKRKKVSRSKNMAKRKKDPVTQPVPMRGETERPTRQGWTERLSWPKRPPSEQLPQARLVRLNDDNQPLAASPIPMTGREMTFGRDPTQATLVLDAPCVEPLHARLKHTEDDHYLLLDHGTTAGTWVNFAPISVEGANLEHGDLIHIGKVPFRFELGQAIHLRKPTIKSYNENQ